MYFIQMARTPSRNLAPLLLLFLLLVTIQTAPNPSVQQVILRQRLMEEHPDMFPNNESLDVYLNTMNQLSIIQHKLNVLNQNSPSIQQDENDHDDFAELSASTLAKRPDQLPYLFEGDIVLTNEQAQELLKDAQAQLANAERCKETGGCTQQNNQLEVRRRTKRTLTTTLSQRWTQFPIPFVISAGVNRTAVLAGIANWERNTCLTFQEFSRLATGSSGLQFVSGTGCFSTVGRISGRSQQVSIGQGCDNPFVVSHEIAHALGFFHEQSRWDRDSFVQIQTQNVQSGFMNQFLKLSQSSMTSFGVQYDLGSVMHYDAFGFSRNGLTSIRTLDQNYQETIGQRFQLSFNDVKKMNFAYCNATCPRRISCLRSGYTDPKACQQCRCPDGLTGQVCDRMILSTTTNCGQQILRTNGRDQSLSQRGAGNCNFLIMAPANARVIISFDTIQFQAANPCQQQSFVEIRYRNDLGSVDFAWLHNDGPSSAKVPRFSSCFVPAQHRMDSHCVTELQPETDSEGVEVTTKQKSKR